MSEHRMIDPIDLARELIRRPSVTPVDAGAMDIVQRELAAMGFHCTRLRFGEIENLYARLGSEGPNLCFAGHTDGVLYGRGAVDMKSAIAAFIAATSQALNAGPLNGSLSFLITGDEEGQARDGTRAVVEWLKARGERIDHCLVGEPTSAAKLGDMIKIGRRGSLNAWINVEGVQGHVAYPDRAANPAPVLVRLLAELDADPLDQGYPEFQPSNLEITEIEIGNPAQNVIPARARARINIRFNPGHRGSGLIERLEAACARAQLGFRGRITLEPAISGEAFLTAPDAFVQGCVDAVSTELGVTPQLSTTGGTSDARFIRDLCPVIEFGLVGVTMHMVDERVPVGEVEDLTRVYRRIIEGYFASEQSGVGAVWA